MKDKTRAIVGSIYFFSCLFLLIIALTTDKEWAIFLLVLLMGFFFFDVGELVVKLIDRKKK